jgi:exosortase
MTFPAHPELVHLPSVTTSTIPTRDVTAGPFGQLPRGSDAIAAGVTALMFGILFAHPAMLLVDAWWNDPNSGHGLLLAPLSLYLAWKAGRAVGAKPQPGLGLAIIAFAVIARYAGDLAAELFIMRTSMLIGLAGLVVYYAGIKQVYHWWLPFVLLLLSVPIPEVVLNSIALPLQFTASKIGASLLAWRDIPVRLSGNVIQIPRQDLFVAEACSGLRSLTALLSLGVLLGALFLEKWPLRVVLVALTIPIAILINGVRIFLTGFLVYFVDPALGKGFMHETEGMLMFATAFLATGFITWLMSKGESYAMRKEEV